MLLAEIKRDPIPTLPSYHKTLNPDDKPDRFTKIGSGIGAGIMDSSIYLDNKHPNQILKVVPIRSKSDSYYRYLRMIQQHQNNPFFPRIYGLRIYDMEQTTQRSEHDGFEYEIPAHLLLYVWMEKLQPLTNFDESHVRQLLQNVGINYTGRLTDDLSLRQSFRHYHTRHKIKQNTSMPKFAEALRLLEPMFKHYQNDMHIENIMVRLTGVGPQLVIVDPLYPSFGEYE